MRPISASAERTLASRIPAPVALARGGSDTRRTFFSVMPGLDPGIDGFFFPQVFSAAETPRKK